MFTNCVEFRNECVAAASSTKHRTEQCPILNCLADRVVELAARSTAVHTLLSFEMNVKCSLEIGSEVRHYRFKEIESFRVDSNGV